MADLDKALDSNAHRPRELPSDNIQTLNVKDTKGKARISRTRISHGAVAMDSNSPTHQNKLISNANKASESDQFIFNNAEENNNRLMIIEDVQVED